MTPPFGQGPNANTGRAGRVLVASNGSVPGHLDVIAIGGAARLEENSKTLPGTVQVSSRFCQK